MIEKIDQMIREYLQCDFYQEKELKEEIYLSLLSLVKKTKLGTKLLKDEEFRSYFDYFIANYIHKLKYDIFFKKKYEKFGIKAFLTLILKFILLSYEKQKKKPDYQLYDNFNFEKNEDIFKDEKKEWIIKKIQQKKTGFRAKTLLKEFLQNKISYKDFFKYAVELYKNKNSFKAALSAFKKRLRENFKNE